MLTAKISTPRFPRMGYFDQRPKCIIDRFRIGEGAGNVGVEQYNIRAIGTRLGILADDTAAEVVFFPHGRISSLFDALHAVAALASLLPGR